MKFGIVFILSLACIVSVNCKAVNEALKEDCSTETLEKLSFKEFLEKSKKCNDETRKVFETKYVDHIFEVKGPLVDNDNKEPIEESKEKSFIVVKNVDKIKNVLDKFGDLIHNFGVDFEQIDEQQGKEIVQHLNGKKLESYTALSLRNCKGQVLDEWKKSFPKVTDFWFSSSSKDKFEVKSGKKLHELLPELVSLELDYTRDSDWEFFGNNFENLNDLQVDLPEKKEQNRPDDTHVLNLLKNSKGLEYLTITNTNLKLLKEISENLLELKNLTLNSLSKNYLNGDSESVEFKSVKFLNISIKTNAFPEKISFSELEGVQLTVPKFTEEWLQLITNDGVNTFSLVSAKSKLTLEELLKISGQLKHLKEIEIVLQSKFAANEIETFVEDNKELKSLTMFIKMEESEQKIFEERFDSHWNTNITQTNKLKDKEAVKVTVIRIDDDNGNGGNGSGAGSMATHSVVQLTIISLIAALLKSFGENV